MSSPEESPAEQFGPYEVFERLGVGGMATVHRARQHGIEGVQRVVALKRLLPHLAEDAGFVKSFVREAKLALLLQHANIVQLFELGKVRNVYFIAMEYIDGRDLRQVLRQARKVSGPPTINVTVSLLIQACEALEYAHTRQDDHGQPLGLVHRDVSPSNLMVTRTGHLKVIDFGIAKAQTKQLSTNTGRVKGKLAYMSPEASAGDDLDGRSDLFSIGVIAHELLTARPLFAAKSEYQTLVNVQRAEVLPPSAFNQAVPPELDNIVAKALARDRDDRYASAAELRDDLHAVRIRYQLAATNREVQAWSDWAFSLESPGASWSGAQATLSSTKTPLPLRHLPIRAASERSPTTPSSPGPRAASGGDAEDEAAAIAWGGGGPDGGADGEHDDADPGVRDHAPSGRASTGPTREVRDAGPRRGATADAGVATPIAASIERDSRDLSSGVRIDGRRRGADVVKIGLGVAIAAAVAAIAFLVLERGRDRAGSRPEASGAELGTLKFIVEPAGATIKIAGLDPHPGAPWTVPIEPGVIQIKISHDGFQSWGTSIELSPRETQTVRVVLSPAAAEDKHATLILGSDPPGLVVVLDGKQLPDRTPVKLTVDPGPHELALLENGQVAWTQRVEAEERTQYEFQPSMSEVKRREREARVATAPPSPRPVPPVAPLAVVDAGVVAAAVDAAPLAVGAGSAVVAAGAGSSVGSGGDTGTGSSTGTGSGAGSAVVAAVLPRTPIDAGVGAGSAVPRVGSGSGASPPPVAAVVVPPTAVKRTSGELPKIKIIDRPGQPAPTSVQAKICIDTGGRVTSAKVLKLAGDVASELEAAIRAWRYTPYLAAGAARPACFVASFGLNTKTVEK